MHASWAELIALHWRSVIAVWASDCDAIQGVIDLYGVSVIEKVLGG